MLMLDYLEHYAIIFCSEFNQDKIHALLVLVALKQKPQALDGPVR